jgi:hypothetical protein
VRRTFNTFVFCARTPAEMEDRLRGMRKFSHFADLPRQDLLKILKDDWNALVGSPAEVSAQITALGAVGITEVSLQWTGMEDIEGLELLAAEVLPAVSTAA